MFNEMTKTKELLDKSKITFWLDCGTLLWAIRDNQPDPIDTDFAIYEKDLPKLMANLNNFIKNGFTIYNIFTHPVKGITEISLMFDNRKVDIFIKFRKKDWFYTIANNNGEYIVAKWLKKHFNSLEKYKLGNMVWNVPKYPKEYLKLYYGDWQVHKPDWNWITDPPCIDKDFKI